MPKTTHAGASAYGLEGVVEDAYGKRSELDPSRNLDGTAVDGFESDTREDIETPDDDTRELNEARPPLAGEPDIRPDFEGTPDEEAEETDEEAEEKSEEPAESKPKARAPRASRTAK